MTETLQQNVGAREDASVQSTWGYVFGGGGAPSGEGGSHGALGLCRGRWDIAGGSLLSTLLLAFVVVVVVVLLLMSLLFAVVAFSVNVFVVNCFGKNYTFAYSRPPLPPPLPLVSSRRKRQPPPPSSRF